MPRIAVLVAVVVVVGALSGCGPDKAAPAETARPGAYCRQSGQRAVTDAGSPVVCTTTAADGRLRWRADR